MFLVFSKKANVESTCTVYSRPDGQLDAHLLRGKSAYVAKQAPKGGHGWAVDDAGVKVTFTLAAFSKEDIKIYLEQWPDAKVKAEVSELRIVMLGNSEDHNFYNRDRWAEWGYSGPKGI
jgi:hypothetical protein